MEKNDPHLSQFQLLILHGLNAAILSHFGVQSLIKEGNEGGILNGDDIAVPELKIMIKHVATDMNKTDTAVCYLENELNNNC